MSAQNLRVTLIQSKLHWENIDANLQMFSEKISSVTNTDLILLPEMFSTGFSMKPEQFAEEMNGKTFQWMKNISKEKNAVVCGSVMMKAAESPSGDSAGTKFFNRLIWMQPDGNYFTYDKRHLFRMGEENNHYSAGKKKLIVELNGWKICPLVCYDLRFPVWSRNTENYDLLFYVANWPDRRIHAWSSLLLARAIENQSYVIGVNRVGYDGNQILHSGDSSVFDMKGEILFQEADIEIIHTIELSKTDLENYREEFPVLLDKDNFTLEL